MNMVLVNSNKIDTTEEFLRMENLRLMRENAMLKEQLRDENNSISKEEMLVKYIRYYSEDNEVLV